MPLNRFLRRMRVTEHRSKARPDDGYRYRSSIRPPRALTAVPGATDAMAYPDSPSLPRPQPSADKPDGLLTEPREAHLALVIAKHPITLGCVNSATRGMSLLACHRSYAAREAWYEAGRAINRIAETPRRDIEATSTLRTSDHSFHQTPSRPANGGPVPADEVRRHPELGEEKT